MGLFSACAPGAGLVALGVGGRAEATARVQLGSIVTGFYDEAPFEFVEVFYNAVGRYSLARGMKSLGAYPEGDPDPIPIMQAFLKEAKTGDAVVAARAKSAVRKIMHAVALDYATTVQPAELLYGLAMFFQELQRRKYVLDGMDDSWDPVKITQQALVNCPW
jgi:hypothetical protein